MTTQIGFTGTRRGMNEDQKWLVKGILLAAQPFILRHGDCKGADMQVHNLAEEMGGCEKIIIHPPADERHRAFCKGGELRQPFPYLTRNEHIVDMCDILIATPKESVQPSQVRGLGTWYTVRYARKASRITLVIPRLV